MSVTQTIVRLLFFRITREEMLRFEPKHFVAGLIGTWLAGIGRYWDDPGASWLQHAGLGSVIYIFLLSLFIWVIVLPFRVERWTYFHVLTFVSLTSFPAIFYAIPVEKYYSVATSNSINAGFLAVVAAWRLSLYCFFLRRFTRLQSSSILSITLLPVCVIITTLTILNLHRVVFDMMGGRRDPNPHDSSYSILMILTVISAILLVPVLIIYLTGVYRAGKTRGNREKE